MISNKLKLEKHHLILIAILFIALFFRTFKIVEWMVFDHDRDLFSWIIKDIVIDGHLRLIGQLTSAPGIYIGPLFYYFLIPFFLIFKMDPVASFIPITIIGFLYFCSLYWVFKKLFNQTLALIVIFIQAVSVTQIWFDRRIVPSTPTNLWVVWYFYVVISLARGNFNVLPILGVLISLIWHIHIALIPTLVAVPVAILISRKLPTLKNCLLFLASLFITSLPLIIFEIKHQFIQATSFISNFSGSHGGHIGAAKLNLITIKLSENLHNLLFSPQVVQINHDALLHLTVLLGVVLVLKKILSLKDVLPLTAWFISVIAFYTFSSIVISEYYFFNLEIILMLFLSTGLYSVFKSSNKGKLIVILILALMFIKTFFFFVDYYFYNIGYPEKKGVVDFISSDAKSKGFPCVAVSYITSPGENVGFRYLFFLKNLHVNQPSSGAPVYTIVIPEELAYGEGMVKFGHIGLIPPNPKEVKSKEKVLKSCSGENANLTDPMLGYTD